MPSGHHYLSPLKKIIVGICALMMTIGAAAHSLRYESIPQGLQTLIEKMNPEEHVAIIVQSMETGHTFFSKNANEFFAPASVQKLFTVSSALVNLKPDYRFPTRLLSTGKINNGILHGDVIFQFNGDPTLTQATLDEFAKKLASLGIREIAGNVIIDDVAYDHASYPPGWLLTDLSSDFAAPLNTVIINRNRFGLQIVPSHKIGARPTIIPQLPPGSAIFINDMVTTKYPQYNCPLKFESNAQNQYVFHGCLSQHQGTQRRALAIRNMQMFTKGLIHELFVKHHIEFRGNTLAGKGPANATILAEHYSAPLSKVIVHLLKKSDNLYADALLKKIGEHTQHTSGGWRSGVRAVMHTMLHYAGINTNNLQLHDGAGLSQYNKVTPQSVSQLLYYIYHNPMLRQTLIPALPIAGVDGTLAWRMPTLAHGDRLRAKTGSFQGVSTLAGFIQTEHHGVLSFVIMVNNVPKNRGPTLFLENHIGEFLARS